MPRKREAYAALIGWGAFGEKEEWGNNGSVKKRELGVCIEQKHIYG